MLEAQIKSLLEQNEEEKVIDVGDLHIDTKRRYVTKNGGELKLSSKEYKLLTTFLHSEGSVLSRQSLLGYTFKGVRDVEEGSIDTLVCRLRKKIGEEYVETIHGEGYRLNLDYVNGDRVSKAI